MMDIGKRTTSPKRSLANFKREVVTPLRLSATSVPACRHVALFLLRLRSSGKIGTLLLLLCVAAATWQRVAAQTRSGQSLFSVPASVWADRAAAKEVEIIRHSNSYVRYRQRTIDSRRDELRDVVESKDGAVARLLMRDNRPLATEEDRAERDRLNSLVDRPADFQRHMKNEANSRRQAIDLIKLMPQAMIYTYSADQTPAQNGNAPQVVLDFEPNPAFSPPTTESQALTGLRGRIWIDANENAIVRLNADIFQSVNFGWGILARVYPGGKLDLEQGLPLPGRWNLTDFHERVTVKALLVKTIAVASEVHSFDFQQLPGLLSYQDAIHLLLDTPLPK